MGIYYVVEMFGPRVREEDRQWEETAILGKSVWVSRSAAAADLRAREEASAESGVPMYPHRIVQVTTARRVCT
jgi:hypothetical protein